MKRIFFSFFFFVIVTIVALQLAFSPLIDKAIEHYYRNQLYTYYNDLVKGTFYLLMEEFDRLPEQQWPQHIEHLQSRFGYPIDIKQRHELQITEAEQDLISKDQLVVKNQGGLYYQPVKRSNYVLVMGPIEDPGNNLYSLRIMVWGGVIVFLALFALIWALPFWRKLNNISTAALAFGNGQFGTRAKVPRRSALAPLADAFNRMADRIQQLIDAQKELTNAVSHELRTPIARIRFSLEMLDTAANVADRKHYAVEILKDIGELEDLVTESLTYARFDREVPKIDWQTNGLESWLRQIAIDAFKGRPDIEFNCNNRLSRPDREVFLEPRYMGRAVGNLIQNAANHAQKRVELTLVEEGEDCTIHVDDDGAGVPAADRQRVFRAFTRLDTSRSRASGGYGLGLAIVHRVLAWHGGKAWVSDSPLGGARFTICWPGFSETRPETSIS